MIGSMQGPTQITEDWTFEARGLYGVYRLSATPTGLPGRYRTVRAEFDGKVVGNSDSVPLYDGEHQLIIYLATVPAR